MSASTNLFCFSRSVVFRAEIGPFPHRDRLHSASRSVEFRFEFVVGWLCGVWCAWWVWLSLVLHMGDRGPCRTAAGFCWNDRLFWWAWCLVVGLPCAVRGICAHGSPTMTATDFAVPHDYAVPTDAERTRVCNTHHPCPSDTGIHASGRQVFTAHHPRRMRASARELTAVPAAYAPPDARGRQSRGPSEPPHERCAT